MDTALVTTNGSELAIMPVMNVAMALERRRQVNEFIKQLMVNGVDFGVIPGTGDKPALLKPGAEKLTTLFGLSKKFTILEKIEDWDGQDHDGEPFFYYLYRCGLYRGDYLIAEADGSCNSHETKYRYRQGTRVCPKCGKETIFKSKAPKTGWYCWTKRGGCGAQFQAGDRSVEGQETGRVINPDVADVANTILKMGQKRALVAATLLAVNGSEFFSTKEVPGRDEDDQPVEGEYSGPEPPAQPEPPKTNGNSGDIPNSPADLLARVNKQVIATFDNINHLYNAIKGDAPDWAGWPKSTDKAAWRECYNLAMAHAKAKEQPEAPVAPVEDELPF